MIKGDSKEYNLLEKWAKDFNCQGYKTAEIGVRQGLGSKIILDSCQNYSTHIGIDPYANLKYQHYDNILPCSIDYTDEMRDQLLKDFKIYRHKFNLVNITDCEFMETKFWQESTYAFVHFDGPHMSRDVITQALWFANRSAPHTRFVFDDYKKYKMAIITVALTLFNFKILERGKTRMCLEKLSYA